jgi:hypothetical protein
MEYQQSRNYKKKNQTKQMIELSNRQETKLK